MTDLASRIISAMTALGYVVDRGVGEKNIVYVEGMNRDGTPNDDAPDKWNDLRCVITFENGQPVMAGLWDNVTTKPGYYYDRTHVINAKGAAIIALGQQRCWQVGFHHQDPKRPALVQTGGPVTVYRDSKRDFSRSGVVDIGDFGINQHDGQDGDPATIGAHSAGCLVARSMRDHLEFMALVKSDPRYLANQKYVFATAVLPVSAVVAGAIAAEPTKGATVMEPASIRTKNPGAMWGRTGHKPSTFFATAAGPHGVETNAPIPLKWGSTQTIYLSDGLGQDNNIAIFPTWVQGICAQLDLWRSSDHYKNKRFADAIAIWSGGNDVESYIKLVTSRVPGMTRDTVMDDAFWRGPMAIGFLKAQASHEAGKQYPAPDADWIEAQGRVFGGAVPRTDSIPQVTPAKPATSTAKKAAGGAVVVATTAAAGVHQGWGLTQFVVAGAIGAAIALAIVIFVKLKNR